MTRMADLPFYHCDEPTCGATLKNHYWSKVRSGWFIKKDDTSWCPKHIPDWVAPWRDFKKRGGTVAKYEVAAFTPEGELVGTTWFTEAIDAAEDYAAEVKRLSGDEFTIETLVSLLSSGTTIHAHTKRGNVTAKRIER